VSTQAQRIWSGKSGLYFVLLFGAVNLFADMTYEGARSVTGPFLGLLGASGFIVVAVYAPLAFFGGFTLSLIGSLLWGIGLGAVPVENQIRTYSWCKPPRIGRQRIRPALFAVRDRGASLSKAKWVRVSL
jgi:hypothetical protein